MRLLPLNSVSWRIHDCCVPVSIFFIYKDLPEKHQLNSLCLEGTLVPHLKKVFFTHLVCKSGARDSARSSEHDLRLCGSQLIFTYMQMTPLPFFTNHFYSPRDSRDTLLRWQVVLATSTLAVAEWQSSKNLGVSNPDDSSVSSLSIVSQNWEDKGNLWNPALKMLTAQIHKDDYTPFYYRGTQLMPGARRPTNHRLHRGAPLFIRPLSAFCL